MKNEMRMKRHTEWHYTAFQVACLSVLVLWLLVAIYGISKVF